MLELAIVMFVILAFIAGLAGIAMVLERWEQHKARLGPKPDPHEILDIRLAKGQINEAEYLRSKHLLTYGPLLELPDELKPAPPG